MTTDASTKSKETQLWHDWHQSGRPAKKLQPLLDSLQPLVQKNVSKYRAADVSLPALQMQAQNHLIKGLHSYSPDKGSLSTHLNWQMRGLGRFVEQHQNFARIPGTRIGSVGKYNDAVTTLSDELGREPTHAEVAKRAKMSVKNAVRLSRELQPTRLTGMMVDTTGAPIDDTGFHSFSADRERLELLYPTLTPAEKKLVDVSKSQPSVVGRASAIAKKMGVSNARISNLRSSIAAKSKQLSWVR